MMRKIKKVSLLLLMLLMCISNFNVQVFAEDETIPLEEKTYSATYEFVLDEEGELPEEVIALLPETKEGLKQGDVLTNDLLNNVETDENIYSFKEWNFNEYTIEDSDIHFVGTWHKDVKEVIVEEPVKEEETPVQEEETGSIEIKYQFIEFGKLEEGNLPQEILDVLPKTQYVDNADQIELPTFEDIIAGYRFVWWDIASINDDGNEYFIAYGAWEKVRFRTIQVVGNPGYEGAVKVVGAGDATADVYDIRKGRMSNMAVENIVGGSYVYCVEPDKTAFVGTTPTSFYDVSLGYGTGAHFSRRMKEIIGIGQIKGASYGEIQAALWNYITGGINYTSGTHYDPDSSFYRNDGSYQCWGTAYESYIDPNTGEEMQSVAEAGCEIVPTKGKVTLKKSAASTSFNYVANCPNNYTLAGAEYGVYTDNNCTNKIGTLTTDANGNTNSIELDAGTYYVKETKASKGFKLDTNTYTARVNVDQTFTVSSTEQPVDDPTYIVLTKISAREGYNNEYLDGAEFTIKYYDAQTNNVSNLTPKYTWVFKPIIENGKAIVRLDQAHFVRGDALILGSGTNIRIPLGTFTIEETKAPETFARDTKVYLGHITYNNNKVETVINGGGWLKVENLQLIQTEEPQTVTIAVQKLDSETNKAEAQGIATLKGAEFTVKKLNAKTNQKETVGKIVTDDKGFGKLEKDNKGLKLLPGTYYVQETKAPNGYVVNNEEFTIEAKIKEPNTAIFDYQISIKDKITQIKVLKVDSNGYEIASAELQLLDETGKVVYSWISDGTPHIIKGLTVDHKYTLHETTVKPNYMIAEDKPVSVKDETSKDYVMVDQDIKIHTTASFKENGTKNYVADGVAHIIDEVEYENLYAGRNYVLKGELVDKQTGTTLTEVRHEFTPARKNGRTSMEFKFNLDDYDNHDFVVFETLYIIDEDKEVEVTDHKDINDEGQTVHVDELYRADLIIYKVDGDSNEPLDGVTFEVSYSRTKADGTLEEKNLGTFVSENGKIELPKMKKDSKVSVKEISAPEGYYVYPEPFTFEIGHNEEVKVIEHTIENHQVKIGTSAKFKESNSKNYVADGVAHIIDTVSYEWLYAGKEYIVKGKLIDLGTKDEPKQEEITVSSKKFIPEKTHGSVEVEFTFNFDGFDEHNFVVFEELFIIEEGKETPVTDHKDPEDKEQTVHTDKLYRAEMVLYKVNNSNKEIKLSGAYFNVTTSRTKRDGTKVEKDLGTFVTGGICAEGNKEFTLVIAKDEAMNDVVKAYNSSYENRLKKHLAVALDLEDGVYYGKTNLEGSKVVRYQVEKGAIILPDQPEDTEISYKEVIAPSGYYLNVDPYVVTVGHDYSKSRIENYRTNNMIVVIPKTGVE